MEWNTFFQIAGVILSSTIVIIQIRNSFQIARTKLKLDLEIFKLIDPNSKSYDKVKNQIDSGLISIYESKTKNSLSNFIRKNYLLIYLMLGLFSLFIGAGWFIYLLFIIHIYNFWLFVPIFLFIYGVGEIMFYLDSK